MSKIKKTIGEQLLEQRKKCDLTQGELYSKTNISVATIGALEQNRKVDTSTYILRALSKGLNFYKFEL